MANLHALRASACLLKRLTSIFVCRNADLQFADCEGNDDLGFKDPSKLLISLTLLLSRTAAIHRVHHTDLNSGECPVNALHELVLSITTVHVR